MLSTGKNKKGVKMDVEKKKVLKMVMSLFESKLKRYNENTLEVWVEMLRGYEEKKLNDVFLQVIRSGDEFPSVGKMIEIMEHGELLNESERQEIYYRQKRKEALLLLEEAKEE